jgi:hypothetical protein
VQVHSELVLAERRLTQQQIAEMFGICQAHVSAIKLGKKWNHLVYGPSEAKQLNLFDIDEFDG